MMESIIFNLLFDFVWKVKSMDKNYVRCFVHFCSCVQYGKRFLVYWLAHHKHIFKPAMCKLYASSVSFFGVEKLIFKWLRLSLWIIDQSLQDHRRRQELATAE